MLNLYENIAIDGIELGNQPFLKYGEHIEGMTFFEFPDLSEEVDILECLRSPIYIKGKIGICNVFLLNLEGNIEYKISGKITTTDTNIKIYLSESRTDKTLKEAIIYTLTYSDIDSDGNFNFPGIYKYNKAKSLAAWIEIEPDPSQLGNFHVVATALTTSTNFLYQVRDITMPPQIDGSTVDPTDTATRWKVTVEGKINLILSDSININLATLYYDGTIPESYYQPPDNNYIIDYKDQLQDNVNKGIYELEQGILSPSADNTNFQIFMSSLSTLQGQSVFINSNDSTYELTAEWGTAGESNRIIVWISSNSNLQGNFTIEDVNESEDIHGEKDGITWEKVCLSGDTLITMHDGTEKRLDTLKKGDKVLAQDGSIDIIYEFKRGFYSPYHTLYYFDNGTVIDETHDHRFYNKTQGFWQRLKLWNIGDIALDKDNQEVALIKKEVVNEEIENFGIFTHSGTYYANGLLSGAAQCNRKLLANASTDQVVEMMTSIDEKDLLELLGLKEEIL